MRLTASTAAAILAITLARAGAVPSPQAGADGGFDLSHGAEGTDFQKRNPHEGGGGGGGGGGGLASYMDGSKGQGSPYTNWQKTGDAHGYQPTGAAGGGGGGGGDRGGMGGGMGGQGGQGGKGGEGEKGQNWGAGHQRRSDDNDDNADETDPYANIACNCFHDPVETDATGLPTVRCGCFRLNNDGSPDLDKRGKTGIIDPFTDWDWWQNQGMKGWDLTPGNPNVPYVDYKFGLWANVGGLGKRDADKTHSHHNDAASGDGWSGEARPKNDHSHENHREQ